MWFLEADHHYTEAFEKLKGKGTPLGFSSLYQSDQCVCCDNNDNIPACRHINTLTPENTWRGKLQQRHWQSKTNKTIGV